MKFLTEEDLRKLYCEKAFVSYIPEPGTKLTPGASQFLADHGINLYANERKNMPVIRESLTKEICCPSAKPDHHASKRTCWNQKAIVEKLEKINAAFCAAESKLQPTDPSLQTIHQLHCQFNALLQAVALSIQEMEEKYGR